MKNTKKRAANRRARRQTATNAYTGPLHEEQYLPALLKLHESGQLAPGGVYIVDVIHDEEDEGNVAEIVVHEDG